MGSSNLYSCPLPLILIWSNLSCRFSIIWLGKAIMYLHSPDSSSSRGALTHQCGAKGTDFCIAVSGKHRGQWEASGWSPGTSSQWLAESIWTFGQVTAGRATSSGIIICMVSVGITPALTLALATSSPCFSISMASSEFFLLPQDLSEQPGLRTPESSSGWSVSL